MKKTTLLAVMALLCLNFWLHAQAPITLTELKVGDKLPDNFWPTRVTFLTRTGNREEVAMSTFKGKAILLDFWACWCGACINHFNLLNKIQAENPLLAIIPVNTASTRDPDTQILELINGKKYPHIKLDMPSIVGDTLIDKLFPHRSIPYYVWISNDGRVRSITMSLLVNELNLQLLLNAEK